VRTARPSAWALGLHFDQNAAVLKTIPGRALPFTVNQTVSGFRQHLRQRPVVGGRQSESGDGLVHGQTRGLGGLATSMGQAWAMCWLSSRRIWTG